MIFGKTYAQKWDEKIARARSRMTTANIGQQKFALLPKRMSNGQWLLWMPYWESYPYASVSYINPTRVLRGDRRRAIIRDSSCNKAR